jgi:hypothetical protein
MPIIDSLNLINSDETSEYDDSDSESECMEIDEIYTDTKETESSNDKTTINYCSVPISHRCCFVCQKIKTKKNKDLKLCCVNLDLIIDAFKKTEIIIKEGSRCCFEHFDLNRKLTPEALESLREVRNVELNAFF